MNTKAPNHNEQEQMVRAAVTDAMSHLTDAEKIIDAALQTVSDTSRTASVVAAALRDAGMLTETEWEYGSEGVEGTSDPDPRPLVNDKPYWPESIPDGVHEPDAEQAASIIAKWNEGDPGSCKLIRRRKAGPWEPVPTEEQNR